MSRRKVSIYIFNYNSSVEMLAKYLICQIRVKKTGRKKLEWVSQICKGQTSGVS